VWRGPRRRGSSRLLGLMTRGPSTNESALVSFLLSLGFVMDEFGPSNREQVRH
jgi:hypothetical protein